jgi:hypothetical protein
MDPTGIDNGLTDSDLLLDRDKKMVIYKSCEYTLQPSNQTVSEHQKGWHVVDAKPCR